ILFTRPFVTGDFIEFDKYQGYVQKIDIMHTNIMTYDRTNVIIPNSVISAAQVNNHTAQPVVRVQVVVPIPYEADVKTVKEILYQVLKETDLLVRDETHADSVNLEKFGDSALEFSVRCFCDFKDYWTVYYNVTQSIKEALDKNDVIIPFNQLDVHIKND
ncbi:MAG: mechanosensitive ion channel family protein, partial [Ruminococcus sp.]|nr:mechanosensitive ion channel family protein [Ruminococcus sp.]